MLRIQAILVGIMLCLFQASEAMKAFKNLLHFGKGKSELQRLKHLEISSGDDFYKEYPELKDVDINTNHPTDEEEATQEATREKYAAKQKKAERFKKKSTGWFRHKVKKGYKVAAEKPYFPDLNGSYLKPLNGFEYSQDLVFFTNMKVTDEKHRHQIVKVTHRESGKTYDTDHMKFLIPRDGENLDNFVMVSFQTQFGASTANQKWTDYSLFDVGEVIMQKMKEEVRLRRTAYRKRALFIDVDFYDVTEDNKDIAYNGLESAMKHRFQKLDPFQENDDLSDEQPESDSLGSCGKGMERRRLQAYDHELRQFLLTVSRN